MANYITVDGGTTNTRLSLVKDGIILKTLKYPIGARAGLSDKEALPKAIKDGIKELLSGASMKEEDIERILASGMISSDSGLCPLKHISLPAGIKELKKTSYETELSEITSIPFVFIRGVKAESQELSKSDVMRGEETEIMGIQNELSEGCAYMLMGSHTKLIRTDSEGKITSFTTMLTGEMIAAIATGTILKDSLSLEHEHHDKKYLLTGAEYALKNGINEALFKIRVLKNVFSVTELEAYSFLLGAILSGEIKPITASGADKIVIGGKRQIKNALADMLTALTDLKIQTLSDEAVDESVTRGLIRIYEYEE